MRLYYVYIMTNRDRTLCTGAQWPKFGESMSTSRSGSMGFAKKSKLTE